MPFRLLSYNIAFGGQNRLSSISAVIREQQPDAVALLEANSLPHAEQLATDLGMHLVFGEANSPFHVAWLSRHAPVSWTNHRLSVLDQTLLEIELRWENAPLFLFATHLHAGRWRHDDEQRVQEMQAILSILRQRTGLRHVLAGDFNTVHPLDTPGYGPRPEDHVAGLALEARLVIPLLLSAQYVDCYRQMHPQEPGYTIVAPSPLWLRLDYLFASIELASSLVGCSVVTHAQALIASDHLPLVATFHERPQKISTY